MADETMKLVEMPSVCGIGRLGATFDSKHGKIMADAAQLDMIERRILRLEMLLRRAGIEPESVDLLP